MNDDITREECDRLDFKSRMIAACSSACGLAGAIRMFYLIAHDPKVNLLTDSASMIFTVAGILLCVWSTVVDLQWRPRFNAMTERWEQEAEEKMYD